MRIFKKEFSEDLTNGMLVNECIITKVNNTQYGNFIVYQKNSSGNFIPLGCFPLLQYAIEHATAVEKPVEKYEYYLQYQKEEKEGWDKEQLQVMGLLGWELCGIQPVVNLANTKDKEFMYIYKRKLPVVPTENSIELIDNNDEEVTYAISSRVIPLEENSKYMSYKFGKNGQGLTDELIILGNIVKELSKKHRVYLTDPFFDALDDIYTVKLILQDPK